jgi:hypothetical protein
MPHIIIEPNGDGAWPDLKDRPFHHLAEGAAPIRVAFLDGGMRSGRPSVAIRLDLPDGQTVVAETSGRLFAAAARALKAKFPDVED